jgi:hypothetical protein
VAEPQEYMSVSYNASSQFPSGERRRISGSPHASP